MALHPSTVLDHKPEFVIYNEFVLTTKNFGEGAVAGRGRVGEGGGGCGSSSAASLRSAHRHVHPGRVAD